MRALLIVMLAARAASADYVNGAPDHVRGSEAVLLVDNGAVVEVIAGVWFEQTTAVQGRALVLVQPRELGGTAELAVAPPSERPASIIWPLGPKDTLPSDVLVEGGEGRIVMRTQNALTLADVRTIAAKVRPLDVGLTPRVIATLSGPSDADATLVAALYDLARDVPRLKLLLQSKSPAVRAAAQKTLGQLQPPANRAYASRPSPLRPPPVMTIKLLLDDPQKISGWLDNGLVRDREIRGTTSIEKTRWPGADHGERTQTNAQWVPLGELLDKTAKNRSAAFAALVLHAHAERFALERAAAAKQLAAEPPCSPRIKDAAYWEPDDSYINGPAHAAWAQLAKCNDADAIALLELAYRLRPDGPVIGAAGARVAAKDRVFTRRLLAHVKSTGHTAWWAATLLVDDPALLPIATAWSKSKDKDARAAGTNLLERIRAVHGTP